MIRIFLISILALNVSFAKEEKPTMVEIFYQRISGSFSQTYQNQADSNDNGEYETSTSGSLFGLRVGLAKYGFVFGGSLRVGSLDYQQTSPSGDETSEESFGVIEADAFVMYDNFEKWRLWLAYTMEKSYTDTEKLEYSDGTGITFGVGYKLFKHLHLNIEFNAYVFDKITINEDEETEYPTDDITAPSGSNMAIGLAIVF